MKVIIVGAGISGLTLAAALAQLAPQHEVELCERDASAADRRKSYAIGLKGDKGLAVLERLGLRDEVQGRRSIAWREALIAWQPPSRLEAGRPCSSPGVRRSNSTPRVVSRYSPEISVSAFATP